MQEQTLEATHLRGNQYAVRPAGALGTCGWINGQPWTVVYVRASSPADAVRKAGNQWGAAVIAVGAL